MEVLRPAANDGWDIKYCRRVSFYRKPNRSCACLNAETGDVVWRKRLGSGIRSQPIAYELDGDAYVAIASGNFGSIAGLAGGDVSIPEGGQLYVFKIDN